MEQNIGVFFRACLGVTVLGTAVSLLRCGGDEFSPQRSPGSGNDAAADGRDELVTVVVCNPCPDQPTDAETDLGVGDAALEDGPSVTTGEGGANASEAGTRTADAGGFDAGGCAPGELACEGGCAPPSDIHNCGACGQSCGIACTESGCLSATAIVAGANAACAQLSDGTVRCWGANGSAQLGNGSATTSGCGCQPMPQQALLSRPASIGLALQSGCASFPVTLVKGGSLGGIVDCWGSNSNGALGNGTTATQNADYVPSPVSGLSGVIAVVGYDSHACALTAQTDIGAGSVFCWGDNSFGQVGNGTTAKQQPNAVQVSGLSGAPTALTTGAHHSCALLSGGTVECWGDDSYGQLGNGMTTGGSSTPVQVLSLSGVTAITAGAYHTCALLSTGTVSCWGSNDSGQLGIGINNSRPTPTQVIKLRPSVVSVAAGSHHTCAVHGDGTAECWGENTFGQLGNGQTAAAQLVPSPRPVAVVAGVAAVAAGETFTCALLSTGVVECWGDNSLGQLGSGQVGMLQTVPELVQW
jgi:alpha-tubulin suppressor-like RCC1 family protein